MNLLLTGRPGIGKTTVLRKLSELLVADGRLVTGVLTGELVQGGRRVGFRLCPIGGGEAKTMAHESFISLQRVGRYGVDVEIVSYLADTALRDVPADVVLIDEIGPMECFSKRFVAAAQRWLDSPTPVIASVALSGPGFVEAVKARADCELVEVSEGNRDEAPARLRALLGL